MGIKNCWIIVEKGLTGTENQCLGVAHALGITPSIKHIELRQPWKSLSPPLLIGKEFCLSKKSDKIEKPWPDMVIAAGRKAILPALHVKQASKGKSFIAFLQNPKISVALFDLVAAPLHDNLHGNNVITTVGAANHITPERLNQARANPLPEIIALSGKKIAVLIGGNSKTHAMTPEIATNLTKQLLSLRDQGYAIMATASRRTGEDNANILKNALSNQSNIWLWNGAGHNPYIDFLAHADTILATQDSVSMLSDAASTGKPLYIISLQGQSKKFDIFYNALETRNIARHFTGEIDDWAYPLLNDAQTIAQAIQERMD